MLCVLFPTYFFTMLCRKRLFIRVPTLRVFKKNSPGNFQNSASFALNPTEFHLKSHRVLPQILPRKFCNSAGNFRDSPSYAPNGARSETIGMRQTHFIVRLITFCQRTSVSKILVSGKNYFAFRLILLTLDRTYYPKTSARFPVLKSTQATKPRRGFLCLTPHYELCELCGGEREALVEDARSETLPMIYLPACPVLGKVSDLAVVSPISTPHITPLTFRNVGLNIGNLSEVLQRNATSVLTKSRKPRRGSNRGACPLAKRYPSDD